MTDSTNDADVLLVDVLQKFANKPNFPKLKMLNGLLQKNLQSIPSSLTNENKSFLKSFNSNFASFCVSSLIAFDELAEALYFHLNPDKFDHTAHKRVREVEEDDDVFVDLPVIDEVSFVKQVSRYFSAMSHNTVKTPYLEEVGVKAIRSHKKRERTATPMDDRLKGSKRQKTELTPQQLREKCLGKLQMPWRFQLRSLNIEISRANLIEAEEDFRRLRKDEMNGKSVKEEHAPKRSSDRDVVKKAQDDNIAVTVTDFYDGSSPVELLNLWEKKERQRLEFERSNGTTLREGETAHMTDTNTPLQGQSTSNADEPQSATDETRPTSSGAAAVVNAPVHCNTTPSTVAPVFLRKGAEFNASVPLAYVVSMTQFGVTNVEELYPELE